MKNPPKPEEQAEILAPDLPVHLACEPEPVMVREFRWGQALRLGGLFRPIADAVADVIGRGELELATLFHAMEDHPDAFLELVAESTGRTKEWVEGLTEADGNRLATAFWSVNTGFFVRCVARSVRRMEVAAPSTQASSSPP